MRGELPDIETPYALGTTLPMVYADDAQMQLLCEVFDRMLGPVLLSLDSFPALLDPATAPDDTLGWLAGWIGLMLEGHESAEQKRELISAGVEVAQWRGTVRGVRDSVVAAFGVVPEIDEAGGVTVSTEPTLGDTADAIAAVGLTVTLRIPEVGTVEVDRLDAVVARVKPAHLSHRVLVLPE